MTDQQQPPPARPEQANPAQAEAPAAAPTPGQIQASDPATPSQQMAAPTPQQPPNPVGGPGVYVRPRNENEPQFRTSTIKPGTPQPVQVAPPQLQNLIDGWDQQYGATMPMTMRHVLILLFDLGIVGGVNDQELRRQVND